MLNQETLKKLITWINLVSILSIVIGAISALFGLLAVLIGAIPGVLMIIMGVKLLSAKKAAQELLTMEDQSLAAPKLELLLSEITTYFKIQGILYIISVIMTIVGILAYITLIVSFFIPMH
jgi:hypothetical protein